MNRATTYIYANTRLEQGLLCARVASPAEANAAIAELKTNAPSWEFYYFSRLSNSCAIGRVFFHEQTTESETGRRGRPRESASDANHQADRDGGVRLRVCEEQPQPEEQARPTTAVADQPDPAGPRERKKREHWTKYD